MLILHGPQRAGFTLVELLVGVAVAAVVCAATLSVTLHQGRLARALGQIIATRRSVREGADVLRYDLRPTAPALGAIYHMGTTFVDFRMTVGYSVVCAVDSARTSIVVPTRSTSVASLTSWIVPPEASDTVMFYAAAPDPDSARWFVGVLASPPATGRSCPIGFDPSGGNAKVPALSVRLTAPLAPSITVGAALRFVRRGRYELYRSSDGLWYLGFSDCLPSRAVPCATLQPVTGPYPAGGVRFQFADSTGAPTSDSSHVARIEVVIRAESLAPLHASGLPAGTFKDSVALTITPRN